MQESGFDSSENFRGCYMRITFSILFFLLVFCQTGITGSIYETTSKLPEDELIWPLPEIETTRKIFSIKAEFVERETILTVRQGNWRQITYLVKYKVIKEDYRYPNEEISFIVKDRWPTRESNIKVKKLVWPFTKGIK